MPLAALALIFAAAWLHATWNLVAKWIGADDVMAASWLFACGSSVLFAPVAAAAYFIIRPDLGPLDLVALAVGGVLHTAYFLSLQRAYAGDLSLVYPVARGTGPLFAAIGGVVLLGERPSVLAALGIALICAGVLGIGLSGRVDTPLSTTLREPGLSRGVLTGALIACYTLWDHSVVTLLAISPFIVEWSSSFTRLLILSPVAVKAPRRIHDVWRRHRIPVLLVSMLSPAAYLLVLLAFTMAPVSYAAPVREVSIVIGTALGTYVLSEPGGARRVLASIIVVAGVAAIGLS